MDKLFPTGDSQTFVKFKDMNDGSHAEVVYAVTTGGGGGGGAGTPVVDNAGVRWLWVYDKEAGTSTYISFATGAAGTPTFPITPDADTSVQVSNFPATQPVSGPLTNAELRASRLPVSSSIPTTSAGTILSLTTAATGTNFTAFASQACVALDIVNNTGVTIEYRRGGAGTAMQIPSGAARMVIGITNADQVSVRRTDTSNTAVTLQAEAFTA